MGIYVLIGRDAPGSEARRAATRPAHLAHVRPLAEAGRVRYAGPLLDAGGNPVGSVIVLDAESVAAARALAERDPYVTEGVFGTWSFESRQVFPEPPTAAPTA